MSGVSNNLAAFKMTLLDKRSLLLNFLTPTSSSNFSMPRASNISASSPPTVLRNVRGFNTGFFQVQPYLYPLAELI